MSFQKRNVPHYVKKDIRAQYGKRHSFACFITRIPLTKENQVMPTNMSDLQCYKFYHSSYKYEKWFYRYDNPVESVVQNFKKGKGKQCFTLNFP